MNSSVKPVVIAMGAAVAGSLMLTQTASANPFSLTELQAGYMQPVCSADKDREGKCGAGKCGAGKCGGDTTKKGAEGKCGAGKCGGAADKGHEGKCGAGKCGGAT